MCQPVSDGEEQPNIVFGCHSVAGTTVSEVRAVAAALVRRHEALRIRAVNAPLGTWFEVCGDYDPVLVVPGGDADDVGWQEALASKQLVSRLPIDHGRPFRVVVAPAGDRLVVLFVAHHAICDGWALYLLSREADHLLRGRELPRRSAPTGALDVTEQVLAASHDPSVAGPALAFWEPHLRRSSERVATARTRRTGRTPEVPPGAPFGCIRRTLSAEDGDRFLDRCRRLSLEPLAVVLHAAATAARASEVSDTADATVVSVPFAARTSAATHRVVCSISNVLPVTVPYGSSGAATVDATVRAARDHLQVPAVALIAELRRRHRLPDRPELLVNFLPMGKYGDIDGSRALSAVPWLHVGSLPPWASVALEVIAHRNAPWHLVCAFRHGLVAERTAGEILSRFSEALIGATANLELEKTR
jgi:hypothetical protein